MRATVETTKKGYRLLVFLDDGQTVTGKWRKRRYAAIVDWNRFKRRMDLKNPPNLEHT